MYRYNCVNIKQSILPLIVAEVGVVLIDRNNSKKYKNDAAAADVVVIVIFSNGLLSICRRFAKSFMFDGYYCCLIFVSHRKQFFYSSFFHLISFCLPLTRRVLVTCRFTKQTLYINH